MVGERPKYRDSYLRAVRRLRRSSGGRAAAMEEAVGGDFEQLGILERELLVSQGLAPGGFLIDVGCGSGRLAVQLVDYLTGRYLGTDVVPDLLDHARGLVRRPDWRFEVVDQLAIPAEDAEADMVCFFSVMTHLLHEESYRYLEEARRVVRPGGKVVFSFLEFGVDEHWAVFEMNLKSIGQDGVLNQFIDPAAISVWARHLDMEIAGIYHGDVPNIPLSEEVSAKVDPKFGSMGSIGQSVAVLVR
jgi:ubiquinone/menaquinone biosynthesis C-methylase UbiE